MQADHFAAYHDEDLVRALTLERANYQDSYLASVAAELAHSMGVPRHALVLEARSTSTEENARFAEALDI